MFPVSGAEQLKISDAQGTLPISRAKCAYSKFVRPGPLYNASSLPRAFVILINAAESKGNHRFHNPFAFAFFFNSSIRGCTDHRSFVVACLSKTSSASYTCSLINALSFSNNIMHFSLGS